MGYYTKFSVEAYDAKTGAAVSKDIEKEIALYINDKVFNTWIDKEWIEKSDYPLDCLFDDTLKWYSCEEDMEDVSLYFPDIIFSIDGQGEEYDDIWQMVVRNGKSEKVYAEIVLPEIPLKDFFD